MPEIGNENSEEIQIDLLELLLVYLSRWWAILISTVLFGAIALAITIFAITPLYTADVSLYVNNSRGMNTNEITSTSLSTSQMLVSTYMNMVESNTVLEKVITQGGLNYTVDELREMLSTGQMDDTEIFRISITHEDPIEAANIANSMAATAPIELENFIVGSSCKIIDYAVIPDSPSSPSYIRNTAIGAMLGFVFVIALITIRHLTDVRIRTSEELTRIFNMPVLGEVPDFSTAHKAKSKRKNKFKLVSARVNR